MSVKLKIINTSPKSIVISKTGRPGLTGKSAYDIAVENGYQGTEQDWITQIEGNATLPINRVDPNNNNRISVTTEGLYVPPVSEAEFADITLIFENSLL